MRLRTRIYPCLIAVLLWSVMAYSVVVGGSDRPEDVAKAAIVACEANLTGFSTYKCRFTITRAQAANPEKALRGEFVNARKCEFLLVVDGDSAKFHSFAPRELKLPKPTQEMRKGNNQVVSIPVDFIPFSELKLNDQYLSYQPFMETAYLHDKDMTKLTEAPMPLTFWGAFEPRRLRSPLSYLQRHDQNKESMTVIGATEIDQVPVVKTSFGAPWGDTEFCFDMQRGCLPLRMTIWIRQGIIGRVQLDGKHPVLSATYYLLEAKEFSRKRWFPTHVVCVNPGEKPGAPVFVSDFRVDDLEVDKRPSQDDLTLDLPAGAVVQWHEHKIGQAFQVRQDEKILPSDIPRLARMLENMPKTPLMDTAVHPPSGTRWWAWGIAAGGICILGGTFIYRRRRVA